MIALSAVMAGIKDIREAAVERAQMTREQFNRRTIMFVDEVHRSTRASRMRSCPTSSRAVHLHRRHHRNPSFEVNSALLSRAQVALEALDNEALATMFSRAMAALDATYHVDADAQQLLIDYADGDGRRFLNSIEQLTPVRAGNVEQVTVDFRCQGSAHPRQSPLRQGAASSSMTISALHKSVRQRPGRCAVLVLFCRMLEGGADPFYVGLLHDPHGQRRHYPPTRARWTLRWLRSLPSSGLAHLKASSRSLKPACFSRSPPRATRSTPPAKARIAAAESGTRPVPLRLRNAPTKLDEEPWLWDGYRYA